MNSEIIVSSLALILCLLTWVLSQARIEKLSTRLNKVKNVRNEVLRLRGDVRRVGDICELLMIDVNTLKTQHNKIRDEVDPFMTTDLSRFDLSAGLLSDEDFGDQG